MLFVGGSGIGGAPLDSHEDARLFFENGCKMSSVRTA